ncbi:unnamed protein product [Cuscuta epithymum]|uniref:Pentatricopeptide repeat-containing protein n=1 Tax=Cuscuta epithymum TaxID=186058 RepID=A0AAV0CTQ5_9ASTE|nr:unnamed protein product [Cuscuta epithymum]
MTCLAFVASGNLPNASMVLDQMSQLASPSGNAMQRVTAYFISALAHRIIRVWSGLYRAFNATAIIPTVGYEKAVRKMFFDLCPFLRLSYVMTNEAIMEASYILRIYGGGEGGPCWM